MAAHLVEMKSYLLLPRSEEGERMKQEFTGRLIEYDQCRRMAAQLREKAEAAPVFVRAPLQMEWDNTYDLFHSPQMLADCWQALSGRTPLVRKEPTPAAVRAAGLRAAGIGQQPGGLHPASAHCGRGAADGAALFPPPEPGCERRYLFGPAGAGARRAGDAGPEGELTMRRGRLERTKENK